MNEYKLRSGPLDRRRILRLTADYIEFENKDLNGEEFTRINKADILDFKHGMSWLVWYKFTVGRHFNFTIKARGNKELKISFRSYFGVNNEYQNIYTELIDNTWTYFFKDIAAHHLDKLNRNEQLNLYGLRISQEGIQFQNYKEIIKWDEINVKGYYRYFALYKKNKPDVHTRIDFNEYEAELLWCIVRNVLKDE